MSHALELDAWAFSAKPPPVGAVCRERDIAPARWIVTYGANGTRHPIGHEAATRSEIARRLGALMGFAFAGEHGSDAGWTAPPYFVPSETLTSESAARLGIRNADDLFGGVVPAEFVATKAITHPLIDADAVAPTGWSNEFPRLVADSVLAGYSAFARQDALRAARRLLGRGPVRLKLASGIAGIGQWVVADDAALEQAVGAISDRDVAAGIVVEEDLADVVTHSIGYVRVAEWTAAYCGTQHTTINNDGAEVYGGSELRVVRGGFNALVALDLPLEARLAIAQARVYDDAADRCFAGFYASRRNYDVAQGMDAKGRRRSGVLEQSWRVGGASGAEIGALEAFAANPSLHTVRAISTEIYGDAARPPPGAAVYFHGVDPRVGALTKFTRVEAYGDPR